jgi:tellurite resistance protein
MSFLQKLVGDATAAFTKYKGDTVFLNALAAACANVTAADGVIEDAEIESAIAGISNKPELKAAFTPAAIESALTEALNNAKTRHGRMTNIRAIQAMAARPAEQKQDVFLIAADVADNGGIGQDEHKVLDTIAKELGVDKGKLLG